VTTIDHTTAQVELSDGKPHPGRRMSEEEFVEWCDDQTRAEWVDGEVIVMAPVSDEQGDLQGWLISLLRFFIEHRDLGVLRGPESQVRLGLQRRRRTPDVLFVAKSRRDIIRRNHVEGAPDLIMEIAAPESLSRDWREKYLEYERAGVREYWVIDPMSKRVEAYTLATQGYVPTAESDGKIPSIVLPGFYLRPRWLWQESMPKVADALRELGVSF
jgi:Uma2 family endonuclease